MLLGNVECMHAGIVKRRIRNREKPSNSPLNNTPTPKFITITAAYLIRILQATVNYLKLFTTSFTSNRVKLRL